MSTHSDAPPASPEAAPGFSWEEICHDPRFQDLPYKIETNARGQILMSPTYQYHGRLQFQIGRRIAELTGTGEIVMESAVDTSNGKKGVDVAWYSAERWAQVGNDVFAAPIAPEIAVEIISPGNTTAELARKRALYFEAGSEEVWVCDRTGALRFFTPTGEEDASPRLPEVSAQINR